MVVKSCDAPMMLIRHSYELIKTWRCPIRRQRYLLVLMQSSPKSATRPTRKARSPGSGNFPSEMENGWEKQQESVWGVCHVARIHPRWPHLGLGLSPLQLKGDNAESLSQIQQCHQHFCLFNSILMEVFFFCLSYGQLLGFEMSRKKHPYPKKTGSVRGYRLSSYFGSN